MPSITLREFACAGINVRTGTQIIQWIILALCFAGLQEINQYYYQTKKVKLTESPITIVILDVTYGIIASLCGLYGAYHNKRIWIKQFWMYLISQFAFMAISIWIYFIYIYPTQPPNPKKTRYVILTTIWLSTFVGGLLLYSISVVYSFYKELGASRDDRQFLIPEEPRTYAITNNDNYPSNMSDVMSTVTATPSFYTTNEVGKNALYSSNFCPSRIPEELPKNVTEEIEKLDQQRLLD